MKLYKTDIDLCQAISVKSCIKLKCNPQVRSISKWVWNDWISCFILKSQLQSLLFTILKVDKNSNTDECKIHLSVTNF